MLLFLFVKKILVFFFALWYTYIVGDNMINKDTLIQYVKIISGCDVDPNVTLVDFTLDEEKRNVVNLVNEEAKKDKKLANLLDDLKYSNNKLLDVEKYFSVKVEDKVENVNVSNLKSYSRLKADNYGFVNMNILLSIVGIVTVVLSIAIAIGTK